MKHLKSFEISYFEPHYKVGDYVLLDLDEIEKNLKGENGKLYVNDLPDDVMGKIVSYDGESKYCYHIKFYEGSTIYEVEGSEIKRKLTPEEIDSIEIKNDARKYNI